jgi:phosphoribosylformylglycinamidine synthase
MWQFAEAVRGLADGCQELGIPVTGGNVSFYNQTGAVAIHPTPVVGVLGILDDVAQRIPMGFSHAGDVVFLVGETSAELSGSEWAWVTHEHLGGRPPKVDFAREQTIGSVMARAAETGLVRSAHDLSDGGLAQALVEACLRNDLGATVTLPEGIEPFVALFSESAGRVLVSVPRGHRGAFEAVAAEHDLPATELGTVEAEGADLTISGQFAVPLAELRAAWSATLPKLFGGAADAVEVADAAAEGAADAEPAAADAEAIVSAEPAVSPHADAAAQADTQAEANAETEADTEADAATAVHEKPVKKK